MSNFGFKINSISNKGPFISASVKSGILKIYFDYDQRGGVFDIIIIKHYFFFEKRVSFTDYYRFENSAILKRSVCETFYDYLLLYASPLEGFLNNKLLWRRYLGFGRRRKCLPSRQGRGRESVERENT